jgi:superfamily II DNA or RNA helicase
VATFSDLFARLDPDPRVRGKQFEHLCKWFLTNDPLYKARLRRVWLWKEWPDRWSHAEAGIDLVAEDTNGQLWAIQAKAYAAGKPIPKRELNKFLAESNTDQFHHRLLIATTDELHRIAQRTVDAQNKDVSFIGLADLRAADKYLQWPESLDRLLPSPPPKLSTPHDYQHEAINDVVKGFKSADRGQLIMACGTGKTLTSLFIKEKLAADRTLVLVPSLSLLKQTMRVWFAHRRDDFAGLPVCSDATVSRNEDAIVARTSELGVPVTTDPAEIAAFLRQCGPRVVFATYQSSPQVATAYELGRVPAFDLVVADEAHRCAGPVSSDFAAVLDVATIKARRRLFMTATPRYFTGRVRKAAQDVDYEIASMDEEATFGTVFHRLSFGDAIKRELLTDYQVAVVGVDDATYWEWAGKGMLVTRDGVKVDDAGTLAGQIGLAKAMRKYKLRRTISFHSRVKRAREFAAEMPEVIAWMPASQRPQGTLWSEHTSGEMNAGQRDRLIQRLSQLGDGEFGLLTNARCLAEGVDVPTLDGVAFIDPRRSEVDIVQAVGRAIRKSEDKTVGTIVIPVFIDTTTDPETALDDSAFKPVWDVVKALCAHDEELGEQLDALRRAMGKRGGVPRLPDKIHFDVPVQVGREFVEAFDVRLVEQTTTSWEFWFGLLERYVDQYGDARVPQPHTVNGYRLGEWVMTQRVKYAKGTLDAHREHRLQELPGWTWNRRKERWEKGFSQLLDYVNRYGDALVPASYTVDGFKLGVWVVAQRVYYIKGTLDADRRHRLQELPGWSWDAIAAQWEEGFSRLLDYVDRNGDARVPARYTLDGYKLGNWVATQRDRRNEGTLDADCERRLRELPGWTWGPHTDQWEEGFSRLLDYVERNGDARVPYSYTVDGCKLGAWVRNQRSRQDTLDAERRYRLQALPGWTWDVLTGKWEEGFSRLLDYVERNGDARVPFSYVVDGYRLGQWINTQRVKYAKGTLDADRQRQLQALPGWTWDARADRALRRTPR